jgi:hypothetical protein
VKLPAPQVPFKPFLPEEDEPGEPAASYSYALAEAAAAARGTMQGHEVRWGCGRGPGGWAGGVMAAADRDYNAACKVLLGSQGWLGGMWVYGSKVHGVKEERHCCMDLIDTLCAALFTAARPLQLRLVWPGGGWQGVWRHQLLPGERALSGGALHAAAACPHPGVAQSFLKDAAVVRWRSPPPWNPPFPLERIPSSPSCPLPALDAPLPPQTHTQKHVVIHAVAAVRLKDQTTGTTVPLLAVGAALPAGGWQRLHVKCVSWCGARAATTPAPVSLRRLSTLLCPHPSPPTTAHPHSHPPPGEDYPCGGRLLLFEVARDAAGQWAGRQVYSR